MPSRVFLPCRHRGELAAPGVHRCRSPKLVGLKLVTPDLCRGCSCRNHSATNGRPQALPRLVPCAYLGAALGRRNKGEPAHACLHPDHELATEPVCRACPDYVFPVLSPRMPVDEVGRLLSLPPRAQRRVGGNGPTCTKPSGAGPPDTSTPCHLRRVAFAVAAW